MDSRFPYQPNAISASGEIELKGLKLVTRFHSHKLFFYSIIFSFSKYRWL